MEVKDLPKIDNTKLDSMHYNGNKLLSYSNKKKYIVISPRELGKST